MDKNHVLTPGTSNRFLFSSNRPELQLDPLSLTNRLTPGLFFAGEKRLGREADHSLQLSASIAQKRAHFTLKEISGKELICLSRPKGSTFGTTKCICENVYLG